MINISASSGRNDQIFTEPIKVEDFAWDVDVETTESVKLMIHYCYHHDFLERETAELERSVYYSDKHRKGILAEYSRMYAMGEKYGIPGLKSLAATKFLNCCFRTHHAGLAASIIIAYKGTPEADKGLRKHVLSLLDLHGRQYTVDTEIQGIISKITELAYALYRECLMRKT